MCCFHRLANESAENAVKMETGKSRHAGQRVEFQIIIQVSPGYIRACAPYARDNPVPSMASCASMPKCKPGRAADRSCQILRLRSVEEATMEQLLAAVQAARDLRPGAALLPGHAAPSQSPAVPVRAEQEARRLRGAERRELGFRRPGAGRTRGHAYRRAVPFFVRRKAARRRRRGGPAKLRERPGTRIRWIPSRPFCGAAYCWTSPGRWAWRRCPRISKSRPQHLEATAAAHRSKFARAMWCCCAPGWARFWDDAARFIAQVHGPGPGEPGARWLSGHGIFAAGSDTVAFEKVPDATCRCTCICWSKAVSTLSSA